jgi:hypothetical protein
MWIGLTMAMADGELAMAMGDEDVRIDRIPSHIGPS